MGLMTTDPHLTDHCCAKEVVMRALAALQLVERVWDGSRQKSGVKECGFATDAVPVTLAGT